jgi:hypothetical protein
MDNPTYGRGKGDGAARDDAPEYADAADMHGASGVGVNNAEYGVPEEMMDAQGAAAPSTGKQRCIYKSNDRQCMTRVVNQVGLCVKHACSQPGCENSKSSQAKVCDQCSSGRGGRGGRGGGARPRSQTAWNNPAQTGAAGAAGAAGADAGDGSYSMAGGYSMAFTEGGVGASGGTTQSTAAPGDVVYGTNADTSTYAYGNGSTGIGANTAVYASPTVVEAGPAGTGAMYTAIAKPPVRQCLCVRMGRESARGEVVRIPGFLGSILLPQRPF